MLDHITCTYILFLKPTAWVFTTFFDLLQHIIFLGAYLPHQPISSIQRTLKIFLEFFSLTICLVILGTCLPNFSTRHYFLQYVARRVPNTFLKGTISQTRFFLNWLVLILVCNSTLNDWLLLNPLVIFLHQGNHATQMVTSKMQVLLETNWRELV